MKKYLALHSVLCAAVFLCAAVSSEAATLTATIPQFTGASIASGFPGAGVSLGIFTYTIPVGDVIAGATYATTFGNNQFADTAGINLTVGGAAVGGCAAGDACNVGNTIIPYSYTFSPAQLSALASGSAAVVGVQTTPFIIQLGAQTLTVTTRPAGLPAPTPEPASLTLIGGGLTGMAILSRRKRS